MCKCYIITSYIAGNLSFLLDNSSNDFILCADGGYSIAAEMGITPDLVIGDFDSVKSAIPDEIKTIKLPAEKDDTDTMACVKYAINHDFKEIIIIGGIGGRFDHTIANLQCLYYGIINGTNIELRDEKNIVSMHFPSTIQVKKNKDFKLSIFAFSEICEGITLDGLKYPLSNYTLKQSFPLGISNEFTSELASISFETGVLLLILSKD